MARELDVVIVGAGFSGLYLLHRLRTLGFSVRVIEKASGVGGTWYWNRYPGARCDSPSMQYCFEFSSELEQQWDWSERYSAQPEILEYANHVADRFDLRRDIQFETNVDSAVFDAAGSRWILETDDGVRTTARFCVMATGVFPLPIPRRFQVWTPLPGRFITPANGPTSRSSSAVFEWGSSAPARRPSSPFQSSPSRPGSFLCSSAPLTGQCRPTITRWMQSTVARSKPVIPRFASEQETLLPPRTCK